MIVAEGKATGITVPTAAAVAAAACTSCLAVVAAYRMPPPPPSALVPPAPPPARIEDLTAKPLQAVTSSLSNLPSTSSHPYTVLSAMLGKPPYQPVFPSMANGIFPKQNGSAPPAPQPPPPSGVAGAATVVAESAKETISGLGKRLMMT